VLPQDSRGEAEGNNEGPGETKLTFSRTARHYLFSYTSKKKKTQYTTKKKQRIYLVDAPLTNLPRFQDAPPDHVRVESSSCCFPRELDYFDP